MWQDELFGDGDKGGRVMKKVLYVNACVTRAVPSRTNRLAQAYLEKRD